MAEPADVNPIVITPLELAVAFGDVEVGGGVGDAIPVYIMPSPASAEVESKPDKTIDAKILFSLFMIVPIKVKLR